MLDGSDDSRPRDDDIDELTGRKRRAGTGRVIFEKFTLPNDKDLQSSLFPCGVAKRVTPRTERFINRTNPTEMLIYTDGACFNNGQSNPRAGCAFVFGPSDPPNKYRSCSFRLENKGPTGEAHDQTSNRAELRAVIGALRFRLWYSEGFRSVVIATDSTYVVEGGTNWIRGWLRRGWVKADGAPVKNKDLWQTLLSEAERLSDSGTVVKLWHIPRAANTLADEHAKKGAAMDEIHKFADFFGVLI